jgi:hypothetical protein
MKLPYKAVRSLLTHSIMRGLWGDVPLREAAEIILSFASSTVDLFLIELVDIVLEGLRFILLQIQMIMVFHAADLQKTRPETY